MPCRSLSAALQCIDDGVRDRILDQLLSKVMQAAETGETRTTDEPSAEHSSRNRLPRDWLRWFGPSGYSCFEAFFLHVHHSRGAFVLGSSSPTTSASIPPPTYPFNPPNWCGQCPGPRGARTLTTITDCGGDTADLR